MKLLSSICSWLLTPVKLVVTRLAMVQSEGQYAPPFMYGIAYIKWREGRSVFLPIPLNYIVRAAMFIEYKWTVFRCRPGYVDRVIYEKLYGRKYDDR